MRSASDRSNYRCFSREIFYSRKIKFREARGTLFLPPPFLVYWRRYKIHSLPPGNILLRMHPRISTVLRCVLGWISTRPTGELWRDEIYQIQIVRRKFLEFEKESRISKFYSLLPVYSYFLFFNWIQSFLMEKNLRVGDGSFYSLQIILKRLNNFDQETLAAVWVFHIKIKFSIIYFILTHIFNFTIVYSVSIEYIVDTEREPIAVSGIFPWVIFQTLSEKFSRVLQRIK